MQTFEELCRLEPRLWALLKTARELRDDGRKPRFCATEFWYAEIKPRLLKLVGWDAERSAPALATEDAYELAYNTIYMALPPCRNCNCLRNSTEDSESCVVLQHEAVPHTMTLQLETLGKFM